MSSIKKAKAYFLIPDKKQNRKITLQKSIFFVGRARENDLIIPSESLSRFHAQIQKRGHDYVICDRGSLNGVFVNGTRIHTETKLKHGDIVGFGDVHARFCLEEAKPIGDTTSVSNQVQRYPVAELVDSRKFAPERRERYLELLYRFSTRLLQQAPTSDLGEVVLDLVHEIWNPDRSCFMLREQSGDWHVGGQRFSGHFELKDENFDISRSLIRELESREEALLVSRPADSMLQASESLQRQNVTSLMCAPVWNNRSIHGFLYGDLILSNRSFSYEDLEMFAILANLMAIKWENDQLWHQALQQQQLEQELNLAADIQRKFFPSDIPSIPGYDLDALTIPSRKVGGDAYFWHERENGELVLMIADVMGKGLPSSLLMSQILAILKIFSDTENGAADIVKATNEFIYRYSTQEKFISMVVVVLSPEKGTMTYCNAGHNSPFLLHEDGSIDQFECGGLLVGVFPDQEYQQGEARMEPGGILTFYTDGITEARNDSDEEFGPERLTEFVQSHTSLSSSQLNAGIVNEIREEWLGTDQEDDWTLLILKRQK